MMYRNLSLVALALVLAPCAPVEAANPNNITTVVDTANDEGDGADIVIGSDDFPIISFYDRSTGALRVSRCGSRSCSTVTSTTTVDTVGDVGNLTSMVLGTNGFPVITYHDATDDRINIAICADAGCTSGTTFVEPTLLGGGDVAALSKVVISNNNPLIFFYDFAVNELLALRCGSATCSALPVGGASVVDTGFAIGRGMSATISPGGDPVVSYQAGIHEVRIATCASQSCAGAVTINTIEDPAVNDVGRSTAVGFGNDGFPVVAYTDDTDGLLRVAKCSDALCNTAPLITTVYDSTGVLDEVDLVVNSSGLPVVSFYERNAGPSTLIVAACQLADCSTDTALTRIAPGGNRGGSSAGTTAIALTNGERPVVAYYAGNESNFADAALMLVRCSAADCDDNRLFDDSFEEQ
jgi:hypothetical protein